MNDGIVKHLCSLKYASVEDAVQRIWSRGQGTLLAKVAIHIEHAHRNIYGKKAVKTMQTQPSLNKTNMLLLRLPT